MIGTRIQKPVKDTGKYTEAALWCNANQAMIEDKGDHYEVVALPEATIEEVREAKLAEINGVCDSILKKGIFKILKAICRIYVEVFRDTPMIVQAMVIYYGSSTVFGIDLKPFNAAIFIILLNTGAYMSETVRGGINSIDVGQIEGAKALGMGYVPMMIYIILPQTFKIIAPQIGNTFVANIKDTSVLNVIAVTELFYITKVAAGTYFRMFEAYTITALIYLTLTLLFNGLLKLIEKYMAGKESYEVLNPAAAK